MTPHFQLLLVWTTSAAISLATISALAALLS